jgi:hypothetical protein
VNGIIESQISELVGVSMECNKEAVQVAAVLGVAALGSVALFVNNAVSISIAVAVAAAIGGIVGWLFPSPLARNDDD